ncbi:MAG: chaperone NapD [Zoogloea sp.]|nr:chaperone NapD [Zoogloea sp.]
MWRHEAMSILGLIVRCQPQLTGGVAERLRAEPGAELAERADADDGRLVLLLEDAPGRSAAAAMAAIALWPEVLNTSLVYEYSGPDSPAPEGSDHQYTDWRRSPAAA